MVMNIIVRCPVHILPAALSEKRHGVHVMSPPDKSARRYA